MATTQQQATNKTYGDALAAVLRKANEPVIGTLASDGNAAAVAERQKQLVTAAVRAALFALGSVPIQSDSKTQLLDWFKYIKLGPGQTAQTGTRPWFDTTRIRAFNTGSVPATVIIGDQRTQLEPGQETSLMRPWAAFIVTITNATETAGSEITIYID